MKQKHVGNLVGSSALIIFGFILRNIPETISVYGMTRTVGYPFRGIGEVFIVIGILCLVGSIVYASFDMSKTKINHPIQTNTKANDMSCGECGRSIPSDANICPYCGKKFDESNKTKFCPKCGVELEGSPDFCFKCGYRLR
ncbi:MAG: zinc ribbon domain-containing protein [Asgard group archaeon]|nr:zinc ribbon domain-containing protein [Asgard group archaeon]